MINIWFDGWFSSAYNIISGIRNNPDNKPVKIFGTHYKPMGYEGLCDKWEFRKDFIEDEKYYGDYEEPPSVLLKALVIIYIMLLTIKALGVYLICIATTQYIM